MRIMKRPLRKKDIGKENSGVAANGFREMFYMGFDQFSGKDLWLSRQDMLAHMLVFGTTGSGKTATLIDMAFNAMSLGSGLCHIDPKGDPGNYELLFMEARRTGRDDDMLMLDFCNPRTASRGHRSNTFNPFRKSTADGIINLLSFIFSGDAGEYSVFQQKTMALMTALVKLLSDLRDKGHAFPLTGNLVNGLEAGQWGTEITPKLLRDYLDPVICVSLAYGQDGSEADMEEIRRRIASGEITESALYEHEAMALHADGTLIDCFKATLSSLGYSPNNGKAIDQQSYIEQFGFVKAFLHPLVLLTSICRDIINGTEAEIDMRDCLFNRRILVCVLPGLERTPQECSLAGEMILSDVKNSLAEALPFRNSGILKAPGRTKAPGMIIVDEYAAIMLPGFEVALTQGKTLGFMAMIATQDYSGMKDKNAKSCDQIIQNTSTKLFMKITNTGETWNLAKSVFGEIPVDRRDPLERAFSSRVSQYDLMSQIEGEFHAFDGRKTIIGKMPSMISSIITDWHKTDQIRLHKFVPMDIDSERLRKNLKEYMEKGRKALED